MEILACAVILLAVALVTRGAEVRIVLLSAAIALGIIAGDLRPVVRAFLETFSSEKFVVPICSAMGFAYVLKHTGCDTHLVRLLVVPVRRVRFLMIPGVALVGFLVNIPVISQTSTAVCLGTVVVPLMRAAGFSPIAIGATLLLGSSIGGELLNPGAPELLTVKDKTGMSTTEMTRQIMPPLVFPLLAVSVLIYWLMNLCQAEQPTATNAVVDGPAESINLFKAFVPLVPLLLLFLSGPPFSVFSIPQDWLAVASKESPIPEKLAGSRLIGLSMLVGVVVAALASPRLAGGCMKAFFEGAGYGYANIISLIVVANCFGKGIEVVGVASLLKKIVEQMPGLLTPLAGYVPMAFAFVSGSGMASTQSLYGFFHDAAPQGVDQNQLGGLVGLGAAVGRTLSPVAAVTLMCARLTDTRPLDLVRRIALPLLVGLTAVVVARMAGWI